MYLFYNHQGLFPSPSVWFCLEQQQQRWLRVLWFAFWDQFLVQKIPAENTKLGWNLVLEHSLPAARPVWGSGILTWILAVYFSEVFLISRMSCCSFLMASSSWDFCSSHCTALWESLCSWDSILLIYTEWEDYLLVSPRQNQARAHPCAQQLLKHRREWSKMHFKVL